MKVELEREADGRWIAEVPALPGAFAYGETEPMARAKAEALALRVIAGRLENGEPVPPEARQLFAARAAGLRSRLRVF
jgi:predicted RNase H-like HicB family nuclease